MAFSTTYVFGFATTICLVCSLAISSVSIGLKDRQDDNRRRDKQASILEALGLPEDGHRPLGEEIDELWTTRVQLKWLKADGSDASDSDDLTGDGKVDMADIDAAKAAAKGTDNTPSLGVVYLRKDDDGVGATGIPVEGMGLWGPISGYIALNPSGNEVSGATFFAPKETPGLGAEITLPAFEKQFTGKRIVDGAGKPKTIRVVKGAAKTLCPGEDLAHCVDGVSGATITCRGVDEMIAKAVKDYGPYLNRIRGM